MTTKNFDVIVLGLGGMGSAAASQLVLRGKRVLGIEQFQPAHNLGSSHGSTRVIRQSYFEDPAYVPLLIRAYELWEELERETGFQLLNLCGGLMIGTPESEIVAGSLRSARKYDLPHEVLEGDAIKRRFPAFNPPAGHVAFFERRAGIVFAEEATKAHLHRATRNGAELHFEERVSGWETTASGSVRVTTSKTVYEAGHLVICPGPWAAELLKDLELPLVVERQILYWFQSSAGVGMFEPDRFPIFIWQAGSGLQLYGFPALGGDREGVKIACYRMPGNTLCTPGTINREVSADEIGKMREAISPLLPQLDGTCVRTVTCMYTNTPDFNFVIATHPLHSQVHIACGFSGHGFKFCSVVGEILADLVSQGKTNLPIDLFGVNRFDTFQKTHGFLN